MAASRPRVQVIRLFSDRCLASPGRVVVHGDTPAVRLERLVNRKCSLEAARSFHQKRCQRRLLQINCQRGLATVAVTWYQSIRDWARHVECHL